jgi:3-hydroxy acid dehydrogenase / malonic semialdehyde reductase
MASPLSGKKFIITGASAGIGLACARALAERGAELLLVARREERLRALKLPGSTVLVADVTDQNFLAQLESAGGLEAFGLINNAGLALGRASVAQSEVADWETMWNVNVEALFRLTRALVGPMLARGGGDILNLCSIAGHWTYPGGAVYCATKHAVWAFTKALREETCGKNLRVMQVSPGMVESEFSLVRFAGDQKTAQAVYAGMIPLTPEDIARQVVFMLEQPRHVCIDEIISMPTDQGSPTTIARHR